MRCRIAFGFAALLAAIAASAIACSNFVLYDLFSGKTTVAPTAPPAALALSPAAVEVYTSSTLNLVATGGTPGYVYYFKSGTGLGTINSLTGVYTAPSVATTGTSDTIEVTDSSGAKADAVISLISPAGLAISPTSSNVALAGSCQFAATGGIPPYMWTVSGGADPGSINSTGLYTTGATTGSYTVKVSDSLSTVSSSVNVVAAGALALSPGNAMVEEGGAVNFSGQGGSLSYSYSLVGASSSSINGMTGVYTASHLVGTVDTVKVTDTASSSASTSVTVLPARPANLVADGSAGGPTEIAISWTNQASSADGFRIERKLGSTGTYAIVAQVGFGVTTYPDIGLSPNKLYYYRVLAYKGTLDSPYSNEVSALPN
ncbi:MAG TPA: fibronectin type III domain-containing protein [Rectinemataceae bacterium]|nr:fibronectin type III domain-containing protein [Rectinemataceae bacterium]